MSVLVGFGTNGQEPTPPVPVPPRYDACIANPREHKRLAFQQAHPTREQLKADCKLEFERFRLKALYLLISYQWVTGAARELGIRLDRRELTRQLSAYEQVGAANAGSFARYLRLTRATLADIELSLELAQLTQKVEVKVGGGAQSPSQRRESLLADFGKKFRSRWRARTECRSQYIVPICRQYRRPQTPPKLVPPSVPLTDMPAGS